MMNWSQRGDFTKGLFSLQLQVTTMLEGVGGDDAGLLMDALAKLSDGERECVVPMLTRVISRLAEEHDRTLSSDEAELRDFENELYEGVVSAIVAGEAASDHAAESRPQLKVISGGKQAVERKLS